MRRIFKDNRPLVQKVLRIIIQNPDLKVIRSETQADMKRLVGARSICYIHNREGYIVHMGLPVYPVERMNVHLNVPFNDGGHILYVNGAYRGDDDIGRLMHDFLCSNPDDMYDSDMAEAARHCKENIREVDNMCEAIENLVNRRAEERAEKMAEERAEKMAEERAKEMASEMANKKSKEIALALISLGEDTFEKIAKVTALSLEEVNKLAGSRTAS